MGAAVGDAIRYNKTCSLTEAISILGTAVEKKNANAVTIKKLNIDLKKLELRRAVGDAAEAQNTAGTPQVVKDAAKKSIDRINKELDALTGK